MWRIDLMYFFFLSGDVIAPVLMSVCGFGCCLAVLSILNAELPFAALLIALSLYVGVVAFMAQKYMLCLQLLFGNACSSFFDAMWQRTFRDTQHTSMLRKPAWVWTMYSTKKKPEKA